MNNNQDEFQKLDLTNASSVSSLSSNTNVVQHVNVPNYQEHLNNVISSTEAKSMGMKNDVNKNKMLLLGIIVCLVVVLGAIFLFLSSVVGNFKYAANYAVKDLSVYIPTSFKNPNEGEYVSKSGACTVYGGISAVSLDEAKKTYEDNMVTMYGDSVEWTKKKVNGKDFDYSYNTSVSYSADNKIYLYEKGDTTYMIQYKRDKSISDKECDDLEKHLEKSIKIK